LKQKIPCKILVLITGKLAYIGNPHKLLSLPMPVFPMKRRGPGCSWKYAEPTETNRRAAAGCNIFKLV